MEPDNQETMIRDILKTTQTIAMVGASSKPDRPSHDVMAFLQSKGYRVIPVNPSVAGQTILGERVYAALSEIPGSFDMVDIFRNSEAAGDVVKEALPLAQDKNLKTIWMQLGVRNDDAAEQAASGGLQVIMNRCPKIEYARLTAELR
ncbi:CoA-binding protein [Fodinicurvata fenggangensis]|uniref:CoA-binding protein n=1 Tax=Fodinicurvata fenggangensis TaxID=1121830 RepID=UPI00047A3E64|nr:CoA-binding protein [Fodinicurvata fenggangensis]